MKDEKTVKALLKGIQNKERWAQKTFHNEFYDKVLLLCWELFRSTDIGALELIDKSFLHIFEQPDGYDSMGDLVKGLYRKFEEECIQYNKTYPHSRIHLEAGDASTFIRAKIEADILGELRKDFQ